MPWRPQGATALFAIHNMSASYWSCSASFCSGRALAMFPVRVWMYARLARQEERDALSTFGDAYARYASRVPDFIPPPDYDDAEMIKAETPTVHRIRFATKSFLIVLLPGSNLISSSIRCLCVLRQPHQGNTLPAAWKPDDARQLLPFPGSNEFPRYAAQTVGGQPGRGSHAQGGALPPVQELRGVASGSRWPG